ncbi:MAG: hypothetical protein ACRD45_02165 [Bryobacteraceae bacterium]
MTAVDLGNEVVVLNATTGTRLGAFDGGLSPLVVMGGGLHPTNGNMLLVDRDNKSVLVVDPHNALVSVMSLPVDVTKKIVYRDGYADTETENSEPSTEPHTVTHT